MGAEGMFILCEDLDLRHEGQSWIWRRCESCQENCPGVGVMKDLKETGKLKYNVIML